LYRQNRFHWYHRTSEQVFAGTIVNMQTAAEVPLVGGNVALDFVNTAEQRGNPAAADVLRTPADLKIWGRRLGVLSTAASAADETLELGRALAARELLHTLLVTRIDGAKPKRAQLAQLAALVAEAHAAATLEQAGDGRVEWRWPKTDLASVRHRAVTAAVELMSTEPTGRLRQCPGDRCGWLFLDTSKRGNRRWCSMRECGQEAKDEQRRARRRTRSR
jgi:predicted RNA-binding Zn ribbon-like protein